MLKFKNNKLIECSEEDFQFIERVLDRSSCIASAVSQIRTYLLRGDLKWNEPRSYSTNLVSEIALNAVMAVKYKYKYLKVVKGD